MRRTILALAVSMVAAVLAAPSVQAQTRPYKNCYERPPEYSYTVTTSEVDLVACHPFGWQEVHVSTAGPSYVVADGGSPLSFGFGGWYMIWVDGTNSAVCSGGGQWTGSKGKPALGQGHASNRCYPDHL